MIPTGVLPLDPARGLPSPRLPVPTYLHTLATPLISVNYSKEPRRPPSWVVSSADQMQGRASTGTVDQSSTTTQSNRASTDDQPEVAQMPKLEVPHKRSSFNSRFLGALFTNSGRRWCYIGTFRRLYRRRTNTSQIATQETGNRRKVIVSERKPMRAGHDSGFVGVIMRLNLSVYT